MFIIGRNIRGFSSYLYFTYTMGKRPSNNNNKSRQRKLAKENSFKLTVCEFCEHSSIHGVKYLGHRHRSLLERIFWILVFGFSIYGCGLLTFRVWRKWMKTPVIVSFASTGTPVSDIPFPAITICPETKTRKDVFNFGKAYEDLNNSIPIKDEKKLNFFNCLADICKTFEFNPIPTEQFPNFRNASDFITTLEDSNPVFEETFDYCMWLNKITDCKPMFQKVITDEGLCYTFNSQGFNEIYRMEVERPKLPFNDDHPVKVSKWSLEEFSRHGGLNEVPLRTVNVGLKFGLGVSLSSFEKNYDYWCGVNFEGFRVSMHLPGEVPQLNNKFIKVPEGMEVEIAVDPIIIDTSEGLRDYPVDIRQCYFQNEKYLRYFKIYTQSNCELECLTNYTIKTCGCVKIHMPKNSSIPVCGLGMYNCYKSAEENMSYNRNSEATKCKCLMPCITIDYGSNIYHTKNNFDIFRFKAGFKSNPGKQVSDLVVHFRSDQFLTLRRGELYGTTDFIANIGGIFGLFMGVSVLSLLELVYYFTVRLTNNVRSRRERSKERNEIGLFNLHSRL